MEPADVDLLMTWENASEDWWMGATLSPISRAAMTAFVEGRQDLFEARQIRWMVDAHHEGAWRTVGAVDLYDFDPRQLRAGVAIHVDAEHRRQGHAQGAIQRVLRTPEATFTFGRCTQRSRLATWAPWTCSAKPALATNLSAPRGSEPQKASGPTSTPCNTSSTQTPHEDFAHTPRHRIRGGRWRRRMGLEPLRGRHLGVVRGDGSNGP